MNNIYKILSNLEKNLVILECGGHIGQDTIKLCEMFNKGKIYTIEANPILFNNLKKIKEQYNNLYVFNYALSDKIGTQNFYIDENPIGDAGASSLLESSEGYLINYIKKERCISVNSITLKEFMDINLIKKIDFMWLDVEGYEYYILNSSIDVLNKIDMIYLEVNFQEFRKNTYLYEDIKKLLENNNFKEINKWEQGAEWGTWQGNVLFKNNN